MKSNCQIVTVKLKSRDAANISEMAPRSLAIGNQRAKLELVAVVNGYTQCS